MTVIDAEALLASAEGRCLSCAFDVRPIAPSDAHALVRFHGQLSDQTIRRRYFNLHRELGPEEVARLTCVDGFNRAAYVVEHDGEIVGVGRYDRLEKLCRGEVAFVVADEFQHHGLGSMLLERLVDIGKASRDRRVLCLGPRRECDDARRLPRRGLSVHRGANR